MGKQQEGTSKGLGTSPRVSPAQSSAQVPDFMEKLPKEIFLWLWMLSQEELLNSNSINTAVNKLINPNSQ